MIFITLLKARQVVARVIDERYHKQRYQRLIGKLNLKLVG